MTARDANTSAGPDAGEVGARLDPPCATCATGRVTHDSDRVAYPYCRECHRNGRALAHLHRAELEPFHAAGLCTDVTNTGGNCFVVYVTRNGFSYSSADPLVVASCAVEDDGAWYAEAGLPDVGEPWGATLHASPATWGNGDDPVAERAPMTAAELLAWALEVLPA